MKMSIPFGREVLELSVDLPEQRVIVAKSKAQRGTNTIEELVREALDNPIGAKRIRDNRLRGK